MQMLLRAQVGLFGVRFFSKRKVLPPRGTADLFGKVCRERRAILDNAVYIAELYGFEEVQTPTFETTEVFSKSLGETSDVISKEMFTWSDQAGRSLSLRPENTASIARALVSSGKCYESGPQRLYYSGSMFRHERPQKGRQREFSQFGVELVGAKSAAEEVDVISMAYNFLDSITLIDEGTSLLINTLGDVDSRLAYRDVLVEYFESVKNDLSEDSYRRLERGSVLRILDSKAKEDQAIIRDAPEFLVHLSDGSKDHFERVLSGLNALGIDYSIDSRLVRGLDYYSHTVFEFVRDPGARDGSGKPVGQVGTLLAGGRYDSLMEKVAGGPDSAAIGWAAGIERLHLFLEDSKFFEKVHRNASCSSRKILILPIFEEGDDETVITNEVLKVAGQIRMVGGLATVPRNESISVHIGNGSRKLGKEMKKANRDGFGYVILLGRNEINSGLATVKHMSSGTQSQVSITELSKEILLSS